jgi:hypothetical protein
VENSWRWPPAAHNSLRRAAQPYIARWRGRAFSQDIGKLTIEAQSDIAVEVVRHALRPAAPNSWRQLENLTSTIKTAIERRAINQSDIRTPKDQHLNAITSGYARHRAIFLTL